MDRAAVAEQVQSAARGDQEAFDALVTRFSGLVWSVIRSHRLSDADAQDAFQTTWLRLVEHLDRIRDPRAVGGWLATTARHESFRALRVADRARPVPEHDLDRGDAAEERPEPMAVRSEVDEALWSALEALEDRCRVLIRTLMADPPPSYEEVAVAFEMPIGSIGPTRRRCLGKLRALLQARGITDPAIDSGS